jgi:SAM-dependent methyltransferase
MAADGDGYEKQMGRWSRRLALPFLEFAGAKDEERILDAGCGTGSLTFAAAARSRTAKIIGLDYSKAYVDYAIIHNSNPLVEFLVGDVCALPFEDAAFDRALSLLVLHFVPQADAAIAEMRRVTRPGGIAAAAVWDLRGGQLANRMFFDTASMLDPAANERRARNYTRPMARPGELAAAWGRSGFIDVQETELTIRMEFSSFDDYWLPYLGTDGPGAEYVATLSSDHRAKLREAVRLAYLDGDPDGERSYSSTAWAVRGTAPSDT